MVAKKRGPTKGARILVELPFGTERKASGKVPGKTKFIRIKQGVAIELGFKPADISFTKVSGKNGNYEVVGSKGSFRGESVTLIFDKPKTIKGSTGTYKTVSLPLGSGCTITDAIKYFQKSGHGVVALRTKNGAVTRWGVDK
jgi:hypothetical protein